MLWLAEDSDSILFEKDEGYKQHENADWYLLQIPEDSWTDQANNPAENPAEMQKYFIQYIKTRKTWWTCSKTSR